MANQQETFWKNEITQSYVTDNSRFDEILGQTAWKRMLTKVDTEGIISYLDCGSNIGRNIAVLKKILPLSNSNIIEIAELPFRICTTTFEIKDSFLGSIKDARFKKQFELVFSMGVLIHVHPDELLETMRNMFNLSSRYIILGEYFSRTPIMINYRGEEDKLFKRDFGRYFVENFDCSVIDYGFLWGNEFDDAGFDDINYWVFEK
jgi:pseudaminic acid biosynthesis-associated methylase